MLARILVQRKKYSHVVHALGHHGAVPRLLRRRLLHGHDQREPISGVSMPTIRTIHEVTLSPQDQGFAKCQLGLEVTLPCPAVDIVLKLENGRIQEVTDDPLDGR